MKFKKIQKKLVLELYLKYYIIYDILYFQCIDNIHAANPYVNDFIIWKPPSLNTLLLFTRNDFALPVVLLSLSVHRTLERENLAIDSSQDEFFPEKSSWC